jgi:hypothetical protein
LVYFNTSPKTFPEMFTLIPLALVIVTVEVAVVAVVLVVAIAVEVVNGNSSKISSIKSVQILSFA